MKRAFLVTALASLALYGCGGGGSDGANENTLEASQSATETASAAGSAKSNGISNRSIENGSFETGTTTGWDVDIDKGYSSLFQPNIRPAGTVTVVSSWMFQGATRLPVDGQYFLRVGTGNEWFDGQGTYDITASQKVLLQKGDSITGSSFYYNGDFAAQDTVWVKVYNASGKNLLATPWIEFSGNGNPGDHNSVPYTQSSDWTAWEWTAPKTGVYILKLGATTFGDNRFATYGFHDAISVELAGMKKKSFPAPQRWADGPPSRAPFYRH
ncbi:hypothetical protein [Azohydromonas caseinilytica]|uniref:Uncharacterized protein n=1 Tax=Azohydromonas caseinilytica TaxID=2728836 RepID=A0A848FIJ5_9BURK|nr:hypothetical protein [Azohydromonas caseinilytica]NML18030.1 hypothetical protein [Azohydromonas caseinilytica]